MKMALNIYHYLWEYASEEFRDLFIRKCGHSRTHPKLIQYLERHPDVCEDLNITLVEIPEQATDYRLVEYEDFDCVYYVLNGKIYVLD